MKSEEELKVKPLSQEGIDFIEDELNRSYDVPLMPGNLFGLVDTARLYYKEKARADRLREALLRIADPDHRPYALKELRSMAREALKQSEGV